MLRHFAVFILLLSSSVGALSSTVLPKLENLQHDAVQAHAHNLLTVIIVTLPDCSSCEYVKIHHLSSLPQSLKDRVQIRELNLAGASFLDYDGRPTSAEVFSAAHDIHFAPSVLFLDAQGRPLHKPLIGVASRDFYGFYLNRAIERSIQAHDAGGRN